jgi:enoyl-CoA hydratase/carnithine racemase
MSNIAIAEVTRCAKYGEVGVIYSPRRRLKLSQMQEIEKREFTTLHASVAGAIGHLVLNRPERLNAINDALMSEMIEAVAWLDSHLELRVVIFKGAGRAFSAGADLKSLPGADTRIENGGSWIARRKAGQIGTRLCEAIEQMQAVTIAQVHGAAVGGGVLLMASCDLRVVAQGTVMFIPEVDLGAPYSWGAIPRMVREIGPALTKELVMTCRRFTPEEAKEWRWINRVVPLDRIENEVEQLARELAAKPSVPIMITKDHVNAITRVMSAGITSYADGDLARTVAAEEDAQAAVREYAESAIGTKRARH